MSNTKIAPYKARDLARHAYEQEKQGNFETALQLMGEAIALNPEQPSWHAAYGRSLEKLERFNKAIESYESAIAKSSRPNPSFLRMLGLCALRCGDEDKARNALQKAVNAGLNNSKIDAVLADLQQRSHYPETRLSRAKAEMSPIYYDLVYSASIELNNKDFDIYFGLWERIFTHIAHSKRQLLLDLGCGSGIFAQFVLNRLPNLAYTGIDFSPIAIELGKKLCKKAIFIESDLFQTPLLTEHPYEIIVCTEILEHIEDDLSLLKRIKPATLFLGSVPNFYAIGHVRYFKTTEEVYQRYAPFFKSLSIEEISIDKGRILYCLCGITL